MFPHIMRIQKTFRGHPEDIVSFKDIFGMSFGHLLNMHAMF